MLSRNGFTRVSTLITNKRRRSSSPRYALPISGSLSRHSAKASTSTPSFIPLDTDLRSIIDEPFSNPPSSSASLSPTGLFGNTSLQTPSDYLSFAHLTLRRVKATVARIVNAPSAGQEELNLVLKNFDRFSDVLCGAADMANFLAAVHPDPQWVKASEEVSDMLCSYIEVVNTNPGLYQALVKMTSDRSITSKLTPEEHVVASIVGGIRRFYILHTRCTYSS